MFFQLLSHQGESDCGSDVALPLHPAVSGHANTQNTNVILRYLKDICETKIKMRGKIVLNNGADFHIVRINPETSFIKVTRIYINLSSIEREKHENVLSQISLEVETTNTLNSKSESYQFFHGNWYNDISKVSDDGYLLDKVLVENNNYNLIKFKYVQTVPNSLDIVIHYETFNRNIKLSNPIEAFKTHIERSDNTKILFSAPYGQGKTTFLNYFFDAKQNSYEVFKVFPVNYSISHNEDIFKYIKVEILFQLLSKNLTLDKEQFSKDLTLYEFIKADPIRVLAPLVNLIPKIGKSLYSIVEPLLKLSKEYLSFHSKMQIDNEKEVKAFIEELYEKEGSVYESNFFTLLIRNLLINLSNISKKENVLIIEDLDRMDPDHIFRILNILSAHFDSSEYEEYSNKFGFDKIILVGDYDNLMNIFFYKYGPNVRFEGYINKYFSLEPFYYNNKEAISVLVRRIIGENSYHIGMRLLSCVLNDLVVCELVTLRDLIKLNKHDALYFISGMDLRSNESNKEFYSKFLFFNLLKLLTKIFDINILITKLDICRKNQFIGGDYVRSAFINLGLPSIRNSNGRINSVDNFNYNNTPIQFTYELRDHPINSVYFEAIEVNYLEASGQRGAIFNFSDSDFYPILYLNAVKYKEVQGLN